MRFNLPPFFLACHPIALPPVCFVPADRVDTQRPNTRPPEGTLHLLGQQVKGQSSRAEVPRMSGASSRPNMLWPPSAGEGTRPRGPRCPHRRLCCPPGAVTRPSCQGPCASWAPGQGGTP